MFLYGSYNRLCIHNIRVVHDILSSKGMNLDQWRNSCTVLHKKGCRDDHRVYVWCYTPDERSLQGLHEDYSSTHKMILDEVQPVDQPVFRREFSCMSHIQTASRIIEVCREYRLPLIVIFLDYEKAIDCVGTKINVWLIEQGVDATVQRWINGDSAVPPPPYHSRREVDATVRRGRHRSRSCSPERCS